MIDFIFAKAAYFIGVIGMLVIIFGAISAIYELVKMIIKEKSANLQFDAVRQHLMAYMALSLDFSIGKDVIETFLNSEIDHLYGLGLIVLIRVVLGFFLDLEIKNLKKAEKVK